MDHERFDQLTKGLATGVGRRRVLKGIIGGAAAVVSGGLVRRSTLADDTVCQTTTGVYCNPAINQADHQCCASANLECNLNHPLARDANGDGIGGSCQCAAGFFECDGHCISTEHCCDSVLTHACGTNEVCGATGYCHCITDFHVSTVSGACIANGTCPSGLATECSGSQQVCCGPETNKPGKCVGKGKDGGNRACNMSR